MPVDVLKSDAAKVDSPEQRSGELADAARAMQTNCPREGMQ
jgi:hypothetical protein